MNDRYKRHFLIKDFTEKEQLKLKNAKVLVCGLGGLGSAVLSSIVPMGIGNIGLLDYDRVESSNLNRQFIHKSPNIGKFKTDSAQEWIKNLNSETNLENFTLKLDNTNYAQIIGGYDIILDCFDSFESKFHLNKICVEKNKILIHAGVEEFRGQVITILPKKTTCLGCIFSSGEFSPPKKGIISPTVNIIGAIQAAEVFKIVLKKENLLTDTLLSYDCIENRMKKIALKRNHICKICTK